LIETAPYRLNLETIYNQYGAENLIVKKDIEEIAFFQSRA
jgi:hypothetical protein